MAMSTSYMIGIAGFICFTLYILSQILDFYGISSSVYGYYLAFYGFLALSILVLPTTYSTLGEPIKVNTPSLQSPVMGKTAVTGKVIGVSPPMPLPSAPIMGKVIDVIPPPMPLPSAPPMESVMGK
jgi:hypothetical protein